MAVVYNDSAVLCLVRSSQRCQSEGRDGNWEEILKGNLSPGNLLGALTTLDSTIKKWCDAGKAVEDGNQNF